MCVYIHICNVYIYIYIYVYMYMYMCVILAYVATSFHYVMLDEPEPAQEPQAELDSLNTMSALSIIDSIVHLMI